MPLPGDLPQPIIYGPDRPDLTLIMRDGRQRTESRTNQNLYLRDADLKDGTYSMGQFLADRPECGRQHSFEGCPMVRQVEQASDVMSETSRYPEVFPDPPDYAACSGLRMLSGYCGSQAERLFMRLYCLSSPVEGEPAYRRAIRELEADYQTHLTGDTVRPDDLDEAEVGRAFGVDIEADLAARSRLAFPALIPQVWLNFLPPTNRTVGETERLEREPQRVDFLMLSQGRKCVIEIDDPGHYATYDETTRSYSVSEERYTRNLREERSLRMHGFEIFRFSNHEVLNTPVEDFRGLIKHLPGMPS
jgi:hypothetical protein